MLLPELPESMFVSFAMMSSSSAWEMIEFGGMVMLILPVFLSKSIQSRLNFPPIMYSMVCLSSSILSASKKVSRLRSSAKSRTTSMSELPWVTPTSHQAVGQLEEEVPSSSQILSRVSARAKCKNGEVTQGVDYMAQGHV